jgi:hypothetical protein
MSHANLGISPAPPAFDVRLLRFDGVVFALRSVARECTLHGKHLSHPFQTSAQSSFSVRCADRRGPVRTHLLKPDTVHRCDPVSHLVRRDDVGDVIAYGTG